MFTTVQVSKVKGPYWSGVGLGTRESLGRLDRTAILYVLYNIYIYIYIYMLQVARALRMGKLKFSLGYWLFRIILGIKDYCLGLKYKVRI